MTHQGGHPYVPGFADACGQVAQLRQVLTLVGEIAGQGPARADAALDEAARISGAYEAAPPVAQRRFDRIAAETERWAALGVETLLALRDSGRPYAAAAKRLADELRGALRRLEGAVSWSVERLG
ncbi:MAG: hypothetical protein JOZ90_02790 [Alphaproteobacteria bacterium]|nr:hypothetical protein [Alphaproteobacteria bacterium]MBV9370632.1 hypothetical protein [Alphaproteobacteria bacterium]MBV9900004.1 hypothetical protein [Alphaproteobacteria bacterium]